MKNDSVPTQAVSHEAAVQWLTEARHAIAGHPSESLLDFGGIDAFELLRTELYLTTLSTVRNAPAEPPSSLELAAKSLRERLFYRKMRFREFWEGRHSIAPSKTDVLFWPRDVTHVGVLVPVAQALTTRGVRHSFLACQPKTLQNLSECDVKAVFGPKAWGRAVRAARAEGARRAAELNRAPAWCVGNFGDCPGDILSPALREAVSRTLPTVAGSIEIARRALKKMKPRMLVVGNDLTLEGRAGCLVAAQIGIPTAVFMHGTITGIPMQAEHPAERIFVYGAFHRAELINQGIAADRIAVCGDPKLDAVKRTGTIHPEIKRRFQLSDGQNWILAATSGPGHRVSHEHHELVVRNLLGLAEAFPDVPMLIKLHRKDRLEYYQSILNTSRTPHLHVIAYGEPGLPANIFDWLQGCSLVLTGASTTAIEAMVLEVPVITMDFRHELYKIDFIDAGATLHVQTPQQLEEAVRQVLADGRLPDDVQAKVQQFIAGTYHSLDGQSSDRAAKLLVEFAKADR